MTDLLENVRRSPKLVGNVNILHICTSYFRRLCTCKLICVHSDQHVMIMAALHHCCIMALEILNASLQSSALLKLELLRRQGLQESRSGLHAPGKLCVICFAAPEQSVVGWINLERSLLIQYTSAISATSM